MSTPPVEKSHTTDTQASTEGNLPTHIGVVLIAVVALTTIGFSSVLGYPVELISIIVVSGITAALGTQIAVSDSTGRTAIGVTVLWISALIFIAGTVMVLYHRITTGSGVITGLVVAGGALLGPFGITNALIRTYGHGAGSAVLRRYMGGVLLLTALVIGFIVFEVLPGQATGWTRSVITSISGAATIPDSTLGRVLVSLAVYTLCVYVVNRAVRDLPYAVLVTPEELPRIDTTISRIARVGRAAYIGIVVYGVFVIAALVLGRFTAYPVGTWATQTANVVSARPVIILGGMITAIMIIAIILLSIVRRTSTVNGIDFAETIAPPVVLVVTAMTASLIGSDAINAQLADSPLNELMASSAIVDAIMGTGPSLFLLLLATTALLVSAVVLSIPSMIARSGANDPSLVGIASGVIGIVLIALVATFEGASPFLIISGVAIAAVVWEVGEFSTVATGELKSAGATASLPRGFAKLSVIHGIATVVTMIASVAISIFLLFLITGVTVTVSTAVIAIVFCAVSIGILILILTG